MARTDSPLSTAVSSASPHAGRQTDATDGSRIAARASARASMRKRCAAPATAFGTPGESREPPGDAEPAGRIHPSGSIGGAAWRFALALRFRASPPPCDPGPDRAAAAGISGDSVNRPLVGKEGIVGNEAGSGESCMPDVLRRAGNGGAGSGHDDRAVGGRTVAIVVVKVFPFSSLLWCGLVFMVMGAAWLAFRPTPRPGAPPATMTRR